MQYAVQTAMSTVPQPLAVIRRRVRRDELARVVPEACGRVWKVLRGQQIQGAGRHIAVYLDDQVNVEIGVELAAPLAACEEVVGSTLPTGLIAGTTHFGPYHQLHAAHRAVQLWCVQHGHVLAGPCWELYGHWIEAWNDDPTQIRTDVCYLLRTSAAPSQPLSAVVGAPQSAWTPT